jgi:uncharacterized protein YjbJ (UPF0337 family)
MNWNQIAGDWLRFRGRIQENWGKLTDDDLEVVAGRREELIGRLQIRYGLSREEAEKQVARFTGPAA